VSIGNAHPDANGNTYRDAYSNSNCNTDANRDTYTYANANSDSTTTYTHTNGHGNSNSNSNTNCDTDANSKPIWECLPPANDGAPYSCSKHAVEFYGSG
jgi:hypothetical protein